MGPGSVMRGIVRRALPFPFAEDRSSEKEVGLDRYGGLRIAPLSRRAMAEEGSYFVGSNPVVSTPVVFVQLRVLDKTQAMFAFFNSDKPGGKRSYLDYIRLWMTTAGTTGVSIETLIESDWGNRAPTAQNAAVTMVGYGDAPPITKVQAFTGGSLTVPTSSVDGRAKTLGRARLSTGLGIVGDEYEFLFGSEGRDAGYQGLIAAESATPSRKVAHMAPVYAEPGQWLIFYLWWLTITGATQWEYEVGVSER